MFRIDHDTAVSVMPTPSAPGTPGYFTKGDPTGGIPATVVTEDWANTIQEELMSILSAASIAPDKTATNQVLLALQALGLKIASTEQAKALTDDGTIITPKKLDEALMGGNAKALTPVRFDNSAKIATTEFVKRQGMQSSAFIALNSATTLDATHAGASIFVGGTTSYTVTLPLAETLPPGARIEFFFSSTAGTQTIQRQGSDIIYLGGAGTHTSVSGAIGDSITFVTNGDNWYGVSGTLQMGKASTFGAFLNTNGYQKLPGGLIIQWGITAQFGSATSGISTSTLPITFPNAALQAVVSDSSNANSKIALGVDALGVSSISISYFRLQGSSTSHTARWFAVGW